MKASCQGNKDSIMVSSVIKITTLFMTLQMKNILYSHLYVRTNELTIVMFSTTVNLSAGFK